MTPPLQYGIVVRPDGQLNTMLYRMVDGLLVPLLLINVPDWPTFLSGLATGLDRHSAPAIAVYHAITWHITTESILLWIPNPR